MEKRSFIITADDYGMCGIVNRAIDACIESGLVRSTNVILNMEAPRDAETLRERYSDISVGLHWNLTAGKPLCSPEEIPTLVDENGEFYTLNKFKKLYKAKRIIRADAEKELIRQYEVFTELCGQPDYWNTHQNSALDFITFSLFNNTALRLGINKTRSFRRTYVKDKKLHGVSNKITELLKKVVFDVWFGYVIPKSGVKLPDGRMIYFDENQKLDMANISNNVCWGKKRIIELVIHPATESEYEYFGTISDMRFKEYEMFSNKEVLRHLSDQGIGIENFNLS